MLTNGEEIEYFEEAISDQYKNEWVKPMQKEMKFLNENHTYDLVELPKRKNALKNKWVYRFKIKNNSQQWYKTRLVVKSFGQKKGVYFL